ncbi:MAG: alanyl-tRNA editing protein [Candidatus Eisenbacteria bacterium]|nr:alanyl-tRNA editing protein [Candidatus Eisenbacteria bacterium]
MGISATERLHRQDSFLLNFQAEVVAVEARAERLELALDQSAFYVESGGQPSDQGQLGEWPLLGLREVEGVVWHGVDREARIAPGDCLEGRVDAPRRRDHLEQHSGQHVLSAACLRAGLGDTVSFHLGREESTIDLAGAEPTRASIAAALRLANDCVLDDLPVRVHEIERSELHRFPVRKDPGVQHDVLRLIEIEGFDWSLCGGTHARRSGEIGPIHVLGWEKNKAAWRVRFLVGHRALAYLGDVQHLLDATARAHSIHWRAIPESMRGWREESLALAKEVRRLRLEAGEREGERLYRAQGEGQGGLRRLRLWLPAATMDEARALSNRFVGGGGALALVGGLEAGRAFWMAARAEPTPIAGWRADVALRNWLGKVGGKGGGNERFAQGSGAAEAEEHLRALHTLDLDRLGLPGD